LMKTATSRWFVAPLTAHTIKDKFELVTILEVAALRSAEALISKPDLQRLGNALDAAAGADAIDPQRWFELVNAFADIAILSTPNADLRFIIANNRKMLQASQSALSAGPVGRCLDHPRTANDLRPGPCGRYGRSRQDAREPSLEILQEDYCAAQDRRGRPAAVAYRDLSNPLVTTARPLLAGAARYRPRMPSRFLSGISSPELTWFAPTNWQTDPPADCTDVYLQHRRACAGMLSLVSLRATQEEPPGSTSCQGPARLMNAHYGGGWQSFQTALPRAATQS
jgi:hypothetical protein